MKPKIIFCIGAGASKASGIPTFRDTGGLWHQYKLEDVCYLPNFMKNYIQVNEFYDARRKQAKDLLPNNTHLQIAAAQQMFGSLYDITILTTNVDNLLEKAGVENVIHLHGILDEVILNYGTDKARIVKAESVNWGSDEFYPVKPNVVFFAENAPQYEKLYDTFDSSKENDIVIVIGCSNEVIDFNSLTKFESTLVTINPDPRAHNWSNFRFTEPSENLDLIELIIQITKDSSC